MSYVELERLGPDGWHIVEREGVNGSTFDDVARMIDLTWIAYGSPQPSRIVPHRDISPIDPDEFRRRYDIDEHVELIMNDVEPIDHDQ